ncbi:BSD [Macleaya cordata]|uniref:BSD n=1 Tax=Macleaya cordata TaxID=56857 RepID=A0A200PXU4_MACCD|nr:BSD [Macleaya cordata]
MAWLARSLVNSLKLDDDDDEEHNTRESSTDKDKEDLSHQIESSDTQGRGVKEDLSEITKTLTRQLWGVASFLAPPPPTSETSSPPPPPPPPQISSTDPSISNWNKWESSDQSVSGETSDPEISDSVRIAGIRSDFAEIGGKFKTGISKLSNTKAVTEISKIASNFLPFGSSEESNSEEKYSVGSAVGVTDEVLAFARNIAMHPETWLDFPLADDEDSDDFDMSDAQQEHALAVENLAPRLAALRIELCPGYMSEGCFWKIYFVLLHSRLSKHDAEVLSTPQIAEARALLMQEVPEKIKPEPDHLQKGTYSPKESANSLQEEHLSASCNVPTDSAQLETFALEPKSCVEMADIETEKHPVLSRDVEIIDKSIVEEPVVQNKDAVSGTSKKVVTHQTDEEDGDDWLEESTEMDSFVGTNIPIGNEEDVSFSDLEEDDDEDEKVSSRKIVADRSDSYSTKDPQGWVQLGRSSDDSTSNSN